MGHRVKNICMWLNTTNFSSSATAGSFRKGKKTFIRIQNEVKGFQTMSFGKFSGRVCKFCFKKRANPTRKPSKLSFENYSTHFGFAKNLSSHFERGRILAFVADELKFVVFSNHRKNWTNELIFVYISLLFESTSMRRWDGRFPIPFGRRPRTIFLKIFVT
jgi:hypothetical protein